MNRYRVAFGVILSLAMCWPVVVHAQADADEEPPGEVENTEEIDEIVDERIGGSRSDAFAVQTRDGMVVFDALPLTSAAMAELVYSAYGFRRANLASSQWPCTAECQSKQP